MRNNRIAIHFSNFQAPLGTTAPRWLMGTHLSASLSSSLPLVLYHMLETHAIHGSNKNSRLNLLSCCTIVQYLIPMLLVSHLFQKVSNRLLRGPIIHKCGSISNRARKRGCFSHQLF